MASCIIFSNVVEKCLLHGTAPQRKSITAVVLGAEFKQAQKQPARAGVTTDVGSGSNAAGLAQLVQASADQLSTQAISWAPASNLKITGLTQNLGQVLLTLL
jgi:hypothetical protein